MPKISSAIRIDGNDSCTSAMRISRLSTQPPRHAATSPSVMPSTMANSTAAKPTKSEMRAP
jgi:hypothetical protein